MAIRPESDVEQALDRLRWLRIEGHNLRHVLPIRLQWRMDRAERRAFSERAAK